MLRQHHHLFERIARFEALHHAAHNAVKGKRKKPGAAAFMARLEPELLRLERGLQDQTYRPGPHLNFVVRDPKRRTVSAAPFRDRVVHHALYAVIGPIFERGFVADSYANRTGFGTHKALARYEHHRDRHRFVLRADVAQYFASVDHAVLQADLRRRIACPATLWLCDAIIAQVAPPAPGSDVWFVGDDLFTPQSRPRGLPLCNLTSQFFANVYLDALDHFCTEVLRAPYVRYVDNFALFGNSAAQLHEWQQRITQHLAHRRLRLHPGKTFVAPTTEPAQFLGFVTAPGGRRRLPDANVTRFVCRLRRLRAAWQQGEVDAAHVHQRIQAWVAHASQAQTAQLRHTLFSGGWFDLLSASRNRNTPDNRNNNNGFRIASTTKARACSASRVRRACRWCVQGHGASQPPTPALMPGSPPGIKAGARF